MRKRALLAALLTAALTGCGGGGGGSGGDDMAPPAPDPDPPDPGPGPEPATADFNEFVKELVRVSDEQAEPEDVNSQNWEFDHSEGAFDDVVGE